VALGPGAAKVSGAEKHVARDAEQENRPVIIKKYANRRLYNTDTSTYVTLEDLAEMVRSERDFVVYDAKTGEDLTHSVLTQIIVEQESRGTNLLPIGFLRQLIRFYGDSMQMLVPSYLEFSLDSLTRQQEQYRRRFAHAFGTAAFEAMQEQVRKNFTAFERALGLFSPFPKGDSSAVAVEVKSEAGEAKPAANSKPSEDEIATLKAELTAMQQRLERLSRG
jgi:polyhydroxyalkanoate synthesis repressor PhaR